MAVDAELEELAARAKLGAQQRAKETTNALDEIQLGAEAAARNPSLFSGSDPVKGVQVSAAVGAIKALHSTYNAFSGIIKAGVEKLSGGDPVAKMSLPELVTGDLKHRKEDIIQRGFTAVEEFFGQRKNLAESFAEDGSRFLTGFTPLNRLGKGLEIVQKGGAVAQFVSATAASAAASGLVYDAQDGNLANLLDKYDWAKGPITEALKVNEDDSEFEGRLKNMGADAVGGVAVEALTKVFGIGVKAVQKARAASSEANLFDARTGADIAREFEASQREFENLSLADDLGVGGQGQQRVAMDGGLSAKADQLVLETPEQLAERIKVETLSGHITRANEARATADSLAAHLQATEAEHARLLKAEADATAAEAEAAAKAARDATRGEFDAAREADKAAKTEARKAAQEQRKADIEAKKKAAEDAAKQAEEAAKQADEARAALADHQAAKFEEAAKAHTDAVAATKEPPPSKRSPQELFESVMKRLGITEEKLAEVRGKVERGEVPPEKVGDLIGANPNRLDFSNIRDESDLVALMNTFSRVFEEAGVKAGAGHVPISKIMAQAESIGASVEEALNLWERTRGLPAQVEMSRRMLAGSAAKLQRLADAVRGGTASPDVMLEFINHVRTHALLQTVVRGSRAEIGRALRVMRETVQFKEDVFNKANARRLEKAREAQLTAGKLKKNADEAKAARDQAKAVDKAAADAQKAADKAAKDAQKAAEKAAKEAEKVKQQKAKEAEKAATQAEVKAAHEARRKEAADVAKKAREAATEAAQAVREKRKAAFEAEKEASQSGLATARERARQAVEDAKAAERNLLEAEDNARMYESNLSDLEREAGTLNVPETVDKGYLLARDAIDAAHAKRMQAEVKRAKEIQKKLQAEAKQKAREAAKEKARLEREAKRLEDENERLFGSKGYDVVLNGETGVAFSELNEALERMGVRQGQIVDLAEQIARKEKQVDLHLAARTTLWHRLADNAAAIYINSILSGARTMVVNVSSGFYKIAESMVERYGAAALSGSKYEWIAANRATLATFTSLRSAWTLAGQAWKEGLPQTDVIVRAEAARRMASAPPGKVMTALTLPSRAVLTIDEFFKAIFYQQELAHRATEIASSMAEIADFSHIAGSAESAAKRGKRVFEEEFANLMTNPPDDLRLKAIEAARYNTFQSDLEGGIGKMLQTVSNYSPLAKFIVPFVKTPVNIMKQGFLERSPLGIFYPSIRKSLAAGGHEGRLAQVRMLLGTSTLAGVMYMASQGQIKGSNLGTRFTKNTGDLDGVPPSSIKIGDTWYQFSKLDPIGTVATFVADIVQIAKAANEVNSDGIKTNDMELSQILSGGLASLAQGMTDKTFFKGIADFTAMMSGEKGKAEQYFNSVVTGMIPYSGLQRNFRDQFDGYAREARTVLDKIADQTPGLSSTLPPKYDMLGRPVEKPDRIGPDFMSPFVMSKQSDDPVVRAVADLEKDYKTPERKLGGVEMDSRMYSEFTRDRGLATYDKVKELIDSGQWGRYTKYQQEYVFGQINTMANHKATVNLFDNHPDFKDAVLGIRVEKAGMRSGAIR